MKKEIILSKKIIAQTGEYIKDNDLDTTIEKQIEYWARLGQTAEENPDLSIKLIEGVMKGIAEVENSHVSTFNAEDYK